MIQTKIITNKVFKTEVISFGFFVLFCITNIGCASKQLTADEIVNKSIEAHGGIETWSKLKHLEFDKETIFYNQDGTIEKEVKQHQLFILKPSLEGALLSKGAKKNDLYYHGDSFSKIIKDSVFMVTDSAELEIAKNTFFAAHYVICQPFKLKDEGVVLDYIGVDKLEDTEVHTINVSYLTDHENSDKWTYYFDTKTHKLVANKVNHNGNISLIKNLEFDKGTKLIFNAHRKSYTILDDGRVVLRAEYFYKNFKALFK
jgi:hypothetical protein